MFDRLKLKKDYNKYRSGIRVLPLRKAGKAIDLIHFLPTASSDAILLESNGHFALVDCAEDNDNPRGFRELAAKGFEKEVLDYLKRNACDSNGNVHLDFIVGTHAHSDHLGGFDTVIADANVFIDKAYLKRYDETRIRQKEIEEWDNREVYEQTVNALKQKSIPIIEDITQNEFKFGNMNIRLLNTEYDTVHTDIGENDNSIGVLIEAYKVKIFLAADIDNKTGDEDRLAHEIGKVNLLKVGHHSYSGSSTSNFLKTLNPDICIVTNNYNRTDKRTLDRIKNICHSPILVTGDENGIAAVINKDSTITCFNKIMK